MRQTKGSLLVSIVALCALSCQKSGEAGEGGQTPANAPQGGNLLKNATFDDGTSLPWMTVFSDEGKGVAKIEDGAFCLTIENPGKNPWDAQLRHREMVIQKGHDYTLSFKAWADKPTKVRPKVGMAGPPYAEYWAGTLDLSTAPQTYQGKFSMGLDDDETAELAFHMGGSLASGPVKVCIDDAYLVDPLFVPPPEEAKVERSKVRVNQLGYFPGAPKFAVVVNDATSPLPWQLLNAEGKEVLKGETIVKGADADSGDSLHWVDFSSAKETGDGFVLKVGEETSPKFRIAKDLYHQLKYDALKYFYHNRSGIEIVAKHVGDEKWARPAGHLSDKEVPCAPEANCDYSLDVTGGWYDAGDHGKYVVNGGISAWTMLNQFERFKAAGKSIADFGDGKLNIPESGNNRNDLLDEARWEVEWLLKMQVPAGKKMAGMVHHKMHDKQWTALGMKPPTETEIPRFLRPVSTAATLNLAAVAAQAARLYKASDAPFAARCLKAAETAYAAAMEHKQLFAKAEDTHGGGPYNDDKIDDEFYWAAAELYATTKNPNYKADLSASRHAKQTQSEEGGFPTAMSWGTTGALGTISLAVAPGVPAAEQKQAGQMLVAVADKFLALIDKQGYRVPFASHNGRYPWGSNSFVLNNMMILAYAHDITKDAKYLNGMIAGMDYLMGVNAMAQSYVTGYGEYPLRWPHHRFWSHQVNREFPEAPPGAVSGGPNSGLEDPWVQASGLQGCKPQKCFIDHIEAWSTNEITINWNAPLAWVAAYLDEAAQKGK